MKTELSEYKGYPILQFWADNKKPGDRPQIALGMRKAKAILEIMADDDLLRALRDFIATNDKGGE
jgi:hypothetical protein